jgi:hypothetical protein
MRMDSATMTPPSPNKGAAGNSRCATSFVSHWFHKVICSDVSRLQAAVPELGR